MKLLKLVDFEAIENSILPEANDSNDYVGIEIEFLTPHDKFELAQIFNNFDLLGHLEIKTDASILITSNKLYGWEIAVIATEKQIHSVIERVCKALKVAKAKVNWTCGLHVHLDMRNRDPQECFRKLYFSQNLLYSLNPRNRLENHSPCAPTCSPLIQESRLRDDRPGINSCSLDDLKTIEVRIHAGTVNAKEISNWVKLLLRILKSNPNYATTSVHSYFQILRLKKELKRYVNQKLKKNKVRPDRLRKVAA